MKMNCKKWPMSDLNDGQVDLCAPACASYPSNTQQDSAVRCERTEKELFQESMKDSKCLACGKFLGLSTEGGRPHPSQPPVMMTVWSQKVREDRWTTMIPVTRILSVMTRTPNQLLTHTAQALAGPF